MEMNRSLKLNVKGVDITMNNMYNPTLHYTTLHHVIVFCQETCRKDILHRKWSL